jgi:hypothetical protein
MLNLTVGPAIYLRIMQQITCKVVELVRIYRLGMITSRDKIHRGLDQSEILSHAKPLYYGVVVTNVPQNLSKGERRSNKYILI